MAFTSGACSLRRIQRLARLLGRFLVRSGLCLELADVGFHLGNLPLQGRQRRPGFFQRCGEPHQRNGLAASARRASVVSRGIVTDGFQLGVDLCQARPRLCGI